MNQDEINENKVDWELWSKVEFVTPLQAIYLLHDKTPSYLITHPLVVKTGYDRFSDKKVWINVLPNGETEMLIDHPPDLPQLDPEIRKWIHIFNSHKHKISTNLQIHKNEDNLEQVKLERFFSWAKSLGKNPPEGYQIALKEFNTMKVPFVSKQFQTVIDVFNEYFNKVESRDKMSTTELRDRLKTALNKSGSSMMQLAGILIHDESQKERNEKKRAAKDKERGSTQG